LYHHPSLACLISGTKRHDDRSPTALLQPKAHAVAWQRTSLYGCTAQAALLREATHLPGAGVAETPIRPPTHTARGDGGPSRSPPGSLLVGECFDCRRSLRRAAVTDLSPRQNRSEKYTHATKCTHIQRTHLLRPPADNSAAAEQPHAVPRAKGDWPWPPGKVDQ
jgi:hypothetical protein